MTDNSITYSQANGEELGRLIAAMEKVLIGEKEHHVVMACLALAITIQCPSLSPEQLAKGVKGVSEWIALFASSLDENVPKALVN